MTLVQLSSTCDQAYTCSTRLASTCFEVHWVRAVEKNTTLALEASPRTKGGRLRIPSGRALSFSAYPWSSLRFGPSGEAPWQNNWYTRALSTRTTAKRGPLHTLSWGQRADRVGIKGSALCGPDLRQSACSHSARSPRRTQVANSRLATECVSRLSREPSGSAPHSPPCQLR